MKAYHEKSFISVITEVVSMLFDPLILIAVLAFIAAFTDWMPGYFTFLFVGLGSLVIFLKGAWNWKKGVKQTRFDWFISFANLALFPLSFYAFWVQMYR